jgi:Mg2+ and Co2+ transporter CorA
MTIAAERLAVIATVTLPITALSSICGINVISTARPTTGSSRSCWRSCSRCR